MQRCGDAISRSIGLSSRGSRCVTCRVRCLFRSPRRQTAYDHKRNQDGNKDSKFQLVHHAFSPSPCMGWYQALRSNFGSLAIFAAMRLASSRVGSVLIWFSRLLWPLGKRSNFHDALRLKGT